MGLDELKRVIDAALDATPAKRDLGRPRLPIDRAFTIQGFGAVVTGTLVDGALEVGQEVEVNPGRIRARVRGQQRHKTKVTRLEPGTRAAVNLSGIRAEDLERGMVLARPGALTPVYAVDVRIRATSILGHPISHDAGITFLSATSESEGKLRLLDRDELAAGQDAWAQIVLEREVAVSRGDHFVIRTPNDTVGGGRILALNPKRHRRNHAPTLEGLARQLEGSPAERLLDLLLAAPQGRAAIAASLDLDAGMLAETVSELTTEDVVRIEGDRLYATAWLESAVGRCLAAAVEYLAANPLRPGVPREHVRGAARIVPADFEVVLALAIASGRIGERGSGLAPVGYEVTLSAKQRAQVDAFLAALEAGRYSPPTDALPEPGLLALLTGEGRVVDTGAGVVFSAAVFAEMEARVVSHIQTNGQVTLAEARDLFDTSRKYAQAFLEALDSKKVTRRTGDLRTLR